MNNKNKFKALAIYLIPILIAIVIKVLISPIHITSFNADEAIVALMARHINQGNLPTFFYGQAYMGSLDAILIAIGFKIFGEEVWVIRLIQSLLYIGTVFTTMVLASRLLKSQRAAFYAGLIMAVPPVNVALYSTVSLGGYGEMLLVGNLLLLGGLSIVQQIKESEFIIENKIYWGLLLWGLGAGFGFWIIGLTVVYSLPIVILMLWYLIKRTSWKAVLPGMLIILGGIIGSAPWWFSSVQTGNLAIFNEITGSAIRGASPDFWVLKPLQRTFNLIIFGGTALVGLRPPWDIRWLMIPLIPIILLFWITVFFISVKKLIGSKENIGLLALGLMGLVLAAGFILTPYGDDPSGRYFLPLIMPMAIFAANILITQFSSKRIWEYLVILLIISFNLGGILQSVIMNPPGITTQFDKVAQLDQRYISELIEFLEDNQINAGYSNYWVSYPLAFLSEETMIFLPRLPYHEDFRYTARDDRYIPYQQVVKAANELAYITTNHPELNDYLREQFSFQGISWEENIIGDYQIFYNLSQPIRVEEIGLGKTTTP